MISLVMLSHNKARHTGMSLDGVLGTCPEAMQFVLLDNGSTDETPGVLNEFASKARAAGHEVVLLTQGENIGAVRGRNEAMRRVEGEWVVWLDNDVTPRSRGWLGKLRSHLQARERAAIVAPKLVYPTPPYLIQCAGCDVTNAGRVVFRGRGEDRARCSEPEAVKAVISACWLMRGELFRELGPLDEVFSPLQFEDIDYCYRARIDAGREVLYAGDVEMYHFENVTSGGTVSIQYDYLTARNAVKFKRKWKEAIAREGGTDERAATWRKDIERVPLEEVGSPPLVD